MHAGFQKKLPAITRLTGATLLALLLSLNAAAQSAGDALKISPPRDFRAAPRQLRVNLSWTCDDACQFEIQRALNAEGPFEPISNTFPTRCFADDFLGAPGGEWYYKVRSTRPALNSAPAVFSNWSETVKATPTALNSDDLLTEVQEAGVRYFFDYGHPNSGLARESFLRNPDLCTTGATGMGLFNLIVGIERKFITRELGAAHALKLVDFLSTKAERFHGAFPHWISGSTGKALPFSKFDDGADLVETAFLMQGVLALREYFDRSNESEMKIRAGADALWRGVEWDWFVRSENSTTSLMWHWSPVHAWGNGLKISGFNEAQITYLLGMASPTHPIPAQCYWQGWQSAKYSTSRNEFGVGVDLGSAEQPLFFTHYSYLGLDPHQISFGKKSYFEHFQNICSVQVRYAESKRDIYPGYGPLWGLTASYGPDGYHVFRPGRGDNGTLAPTASLSSIPYVPEESRKCLVEMYQKHGKKLWGPFGFCDAFNFSRDWVCRDVLAIDVGPIAPMIENFRSGLCWKTFMRAPEIGPILKVIDRGPDIGN